MRKSGNNAFRIAPQRQRAGRFASALLVLIAGTSAAAAAPDLNGYKLIFEDRFQGDHLDLSKWQIGLTPRGQQWGSDSYFVTATPEDATLFAKVYSVKDGVLTIRANYQEDFGDPSHWGRKWFSGMIATAFSDGRPPSAAFRRGYVEIKQKFPAGKGVWPANWACNLASQTAAGDPLGTIELDGLEAYGVNMTMFHTTTHLWKDGEAFNMATAKDLPDLTKDFHVFGYRIGDASMEVYVDGALVSHAAVYRPEATDKFFWMFNLAMGGGWPIDIPPSHGYEMQIEYVKVFSADQDAKLIVP